MDWGLAEPPCGSCGVWEAGDGVMEGRRLVKVLRLLFCALFAGDECLEPESSMAERRLRAPDLGRYQVQPGMQTQSGSSCPRVSWEEKAGKC